MTESGTSTPAEPMFFETPEAFRAWLDEHHATATELVVGFYKVKSGLPSITWKQAVDEALCYGWIDGRGGRIDDISHKIRFTPRRPNSNWSEVNIKRVEELTRQGRMQPAGLAAFERRLAAKTGVYSHEQRGEITLSDEFEQQFRANAAAWEFFASRAPSYRKAAIWWVMSAKRDDTRQRRLATLIDDSAAGRTVRHLTSPAKRG